MGLRVREEVPSMWKILRASCSGTSHQKSGQPCQDAAEATVVDENVLVAGCADGAGSAKFSDSGSRLACASIVQQIAQACANGLKVEQIDSEQVLTWCRIARGDLEAEAQSQNVPLRELACTLLLAVVGEKAAAFAQPSDGAIVIRTDDVYRTVFWPQSGEDVNTTNFLPDAHWEGPPEVHFQAGRYHQ